MIQFSSHFIYEEASSKSIEEVDDNVRRNEDLGEQIRT